MGVVDFLTTRPSVTTFLLRGGVGVGRTDGGRTTDSCWVPKKGLRGVVGNSRRVRISVLELGSDGS